MGEFENVIIYNSMSFVAESIATTTITAQNTWTDLVMSGDSSTQISNARNSSTNTVQWDLENGILNLNVSGIYIFQFGFTVSGSGSAVYQLRCVQNEITDDPSLATISDIQFSTRGTNVSWEVANTFVVNADLNDINASASSRMKGLQSSLNKFKWQVRNTTGEGDFNVVGAMYNVYKIG